jgi:cysteine desulfurase
MAIATVPRAYLDYNATAPLRPAAREAMVAALEVYGNPSSVHGPGRSARKLVEKARSQVCDLAGAAPADLVFTGGGTEANAMVLRGTAARLVVSAVEHPSILENAADSRIVPVGSNGLVDLAALDEILTDLRSTKGDILVSIMAANNETGVIQPIAGAAEIVHRHGALFHVDAIQLAGKGDLPAVWDCADLMSLSAHKLGGPTGVGALLARPGINLTPLAAGGGQERGRRAGTENLPGIVGFGAAADDALAGLGELQNVSRLRDELERQLHVIGAVTIHGSEVDRLPNTSCIGLAGARAETLVMALDLAGVAVSAGSACSSGKVQASHVLEAMGCDEAAARSAIRVSLGWDSTEEDLNLFIDAWADICARQRAA